MILHGEGKLVSVGKKQSKKTGNFYTIGAFVYDGEVLQAMLPNGVDVEIDRDYELTFDYNVNYRQLNLIQVS